MAKKTDKKAMKIFMFGTGFVVVSNDYEDDHVEIGIDCVKINNGATIRDWGTNNGIGSLCVLGPLSATKLDGLLEAVAVPKNSIWKILSVEGKPAEKFEKEIKASFKRILEQQ